MLISTTKTLEDKLIRYGKKQTLTHISQVEMLPSYILFSCFALHTATLDHSHFDHTHWTYGATSVDGWPPHFHNRPIAGASSPRQDVQEMQREREREKTPISFGNVVQSSGTIMPKQKERGLLIQFSAMRTLNN